eukprot:TRINITY_DN68_c0_g1_i1.p1 TRINITY_DN68_c0_g1~~TRINITY_DN68_c0_g1_i1.p1  ORF type:complete len:196 (-),score=57.19 TRINITY_DN68_c0_g1_i1:85-672(-)
MKYLVFSLLLAVAFSLKAPSTPVWPAAFSASVLVYDPDFGSQPQYFRWFYSQTLKMDRLDGLTAWKGQFYYATRIFDHNKDIQDDVYFQTDSVVCIQHPLNHTIPDPDFSQFKFVGNAIVDYVVTNFWAGQTPDNHTFFQYYEDATTRDPIRIDISDEHHFGRAIRWVFNEFDDGAQNANVYTLPADILSLCNSK